MRYVVHKKSGRIPKDSAAKCGGTPEESESGRDALVGASARLGAVGGVAAALVGRGRIRVVGIRHRQNAGRQRIQHVVDVGVAGLADQLLHLDGFRARDAVDRLELDLGEARHADDGVEHEAELAGRTRIRRQVRDRRDDAVDERVAAGLRLGLGAQVVDRRREPHIAVGADRDRLVLERLQHLVGVVAETGLAEHRADHFQLVGRDGDVARSRDRRDGRQSDGGSRGEEFALNHFEFSFLLKDQSASSAELVLISQHKFADSNRG